MFSHFVACCVYGSACANCVSRLSSIGDQEFTWTYPWETGIAELRLFGVLFFVVSPWTVTCYLQKWDPSPDRKSKALKNDAALLRRVERSLVLNGERDVGMGFCETQAVSTWPEVLSNLIIVRVLVKNCLTAVQAWVIQFNNFMQKLCCIFQAFVVLQQSRWASLSLLDCRCLSPNARHAHCRFYGENQKPSTTQKHGNGSCSFNGWWVMMLSWLMADLRTRQKQGRSWANFEFSCLMISSDSSVALDCKILRLRSTKTNSFDRQQVNCSSFGTFASVDSNVSFSFKYSYLTRSPADASSPLATQKYRIHFIKLIRLKASWCTWHSGKWLWLRERGDNKFYQIINGTMAQYGW